MKKGILITSPQHDVVTLYLSTFSKMLIGEAKKQGLPLKTIYGIYATRKVVEEAIPGFDYSFFLVNGHGNFETLYGHKNEILIKKDVNHNLLLGRITYARACDAGESLGKAITADNNQSCFIGYDLPFQFYHDDTWEGNPSRDPIAPLFFDQTSNIIPLQIIQGAPASTAHMRAKKATLKVIKKVLRKKDPESAIIAEALWSNYFGQVLLGNGDARI